MKNKPIFLILAFVLVLIAGFAYWYFCLKDTISSSDAVIAVKKMYSELSDYPNTGLPPKSIKSERADGGWYVAFIQEGSGVPIISARCFFVDRDKSVVENKYYEPNSEDLVSSFSPKACSASKNIDSACGLETCHGLDVTCGANPAEMCTMEYRIGDKCLQYVECAKVEGNCVQVQNPDFESCKTCVQGCISQYTDDIDKQFECESECK